MMWVGCWKDDKRLTMCYVLSPATGKWIAKDIKFWSFRRLNKSACGSQFLEALP